MYKNKPLKNLTKCRILKEALELAQRPPTNISAGPINESNYMKWHGKITGANDTPYEGGLFHLEIDIPEEYPFKPPKITFKTNIYHCNIYKGKICMDILSTNWSAALTIEKVLLSIFLLLSDPNPSSPLNISAAEMFLSDKKTYFAIAKEQTKKYAMP